MTGFLVFLAISSATAVIANLMIRQSIFATVVAAPLASVFFFLIVLAVEKPDPLTVLIPCFATIYALPVAVLVTVAFSVHRRRTRPIPGHCRACGYNLHGNTSGICPECGTAIP